MSKVKSDAVVDSDWLAENLSQPDLRIVDASAYLPTEKKNARALFEDAHIPGAAFFDIDAISDHASDLPHMLPAPEAFASAMRKLGIGDGHRVVIYDQKGLWSAPRAWWMFRIFGHREVSILDGGLPKWTAENRAVEDGPARPRAEAHFTARLHHHLVRDRAQIAALVESASAEQLIDARSAGRFEGSDPEPRAGLRSGHIPGSLNLPIDRLLDPETKTLRDETGLSRAFEEAGLDLERPAVATCGSGVTAAVLALGLYILGKPDVPIYDGSWSDWGREGDTPVETGPARAAAKKG